MDDELLIEYVRQHEALYNSTHKLYNDNAHKEIIWYKIGLQLNKPGIDCKNRWVSIRDQCRKALKKRKIKGEIPNKKWKYEENLAFLLPFFKERERKGFDIPAYEQMFLNEMSLGQMDPFDGTNDTDDFRENAEQPKLKRLKMEAMLEASRITPANSNSFYHQRIKNEDSDYGPSSPEPRSTEHCATETSNAIDSFFIAMAATVKQFSPYFQVMAKSKIFSVVTGLELQQIQGESSNQTITSSHVAQGSENPETE